jgi:amino acid permease
MANRPSYKKQDSFGELSYGQAYKMKPVGGQPQIEEVNEGEGPGPERMGGTVEDKKDMYRLNKVQELQRNFRFLSIFGYSLILGNGWVIALIAAIIPLTNGGTAGGIWIYFIIIVGLSFSTLSMAEMASMAPTAGGQYHWVSEFAPRSKQRFLSYLTGWLCVSGQCVIRTAWRLILKSGLGVANSTL